MRYGTVVQFFPEKGYGFIRPDQGRDIFFHVTALGACQEEPEIKQGQPVKYELEPRSSQANRQPSDDGDEKPTNTGQPRARLVELIDKIPGASLDGASDELRTRRHPRAQRKKPTWRR